MNNRLLFLFFCLLTLSSTAQPGGQSTYPLRHKGRQIIVGSGGGFTGMVTEYRLTDNGYLYARQGRTETFKKLGRKELNRTKSVFTDLEKKCAIRNTRFNHPGNLYYFVTWKKGQSEHKVVWGDEEYRVPAEYPRFYASFMAMIPPSLRL